MTPDIEAVRKRMTPVFRRVNGKTIRKIIMTAPVINVTMPVFNRYQLTQASLLALHKCSRKIPFTVTVVDNGSDPELVQKLIEFKNLGIINKLFLLDKNMGISCAANIGWEMTDAPFYMKLDNDIVITNKDFFPKLFALWSHGDPLSTLGGTTKDGDLTRSPETLYTKDGILGVCGRTLAGYAILIPKIVSDLLGFWSEDYGLYGAEDGDYGLRMHCAGFRQYYYSPHGLLDNCGNDPHTYSARNLDKRAETNAVLYSKEQGYGMFMINQSLYSLCIRTWKIVRKYKVLEVSSDYRVRLGENEKYAGYRALLERCAHSINERARKASLPNPDYIFTSEFIDELKAIMKSGGYDCASMFERAHSNS